jgi:hypothetical protein
MKLFKFQILLTLVFSIVCNAQTVKSAVVDTAQKSAFEYAVEN